jgi:hypothetical protein
MRNKTCSVETLHSSNFGMLLQGHCLDFQRPRRPPILSRLVFDGVFDEGFSAKQVERQGSGGDPG